MSHTLARRSTTRSGRAIAYTVHPGGPGRPVVLHHGIFSTADHWDALGYVAPLLGDRTVIAIDALAHGHSARPDDQEAYDLAHRAADTVAVLDEEGIEVAHVWGYSMGGWTTCGLARHAPTRVAGLVIGGWDPVRGLVGAYEAFGALFDLPVEGTDWYAGLVASGAAHPLTAAEIDRGDEAAFRRCHRACELEADLADAVIGFHGPTLLACGADDPYHESVRALSARAGASMVTLRGDHGRAWIDAVGSVEAVAPFLRNADRAR